MLLLRFYADGFYKDGWNPKATQMEDRGTIGNDKSFLVDYVNIREF